MNIDTFTYGLGLNSVLIVNRAIVEGIERAGYLRFDHSPPLNPGVNWEGVAKMRDGVVIGCDAAIFQASVSLECMERMKEISPATKLILQRDSTHCETWSELVRGEQEKFGIFWDVYGGGLLSRELREYELADKITVLSRWVEESFESHGLKEKIVHVGPQCFDREKWKRLPWTDEKIFRVLFAGQVGLRKGIFYLLEAWNRLGLKNAELIIAGMPEHGVLKTHIEKAVANCPGCKAVGFVSFERMNQLYGNCHVLCMPSIEEGSTMTGLEAMSTGRPVVATRNAGIDILKHGWNGIEVESGSWESIADAINYYYMNSVKLFEHGRNASLSVDDCDVFEFGNRYIERVKKSIGVDNGN